MTLVKVNLCLATLAAALSLTLGANQHLICKTVEDVFTEGSTVGHTSTTRRILHGPPGKRGQQGVKGEPGFPGLKGEKGLPGLVDPQNVENVVEEKLREAIQERDRRIKVLEQMVSDINSTVERIIDTFTCEDGVLYRQKCYFTIMRTTQNVDHEQAKTLCAGKQAAIADVLNGEHEELLVGHIREKTTSETHLWFGMSYSPSTSSLRLSNGSKLRGDDATSLRWWSGHPTGNSNWNTIGIIVESDRFGIFNYLPKYLTHGVVCAGSL